MSCGLGWEIGLVLVVLLGAGVWLVVTYWQLRQAFCWWLQQQRRQQCREAEQVRNGLLQETFALRRGLELALERESPQGDRPHQRWIGQVNQLDRHLVRLGDTLSPPYAETSLPLALRAWAERSLPPTAGQQQEAIALQLPEDWPLEPVARSQGLVMLLDQLLLLVQPADPAARVQLVVMLRPRSRWSVLTLQAQYATTAEARAIARGRSHPLRQLQRVAQVLLPGRSRFQQQQQTLCWQFCWRQDQSKADDTL